MLLCGQTTFGLGWSTYLILPKFFATELGADAASIGRVSAMAGFASVTGIPVVIALIDRIGRRPLLQLGLPAAGRCCRSALPESSGSTRCVFVLQACVGAAFVLAFNASATLVTDLAPPGAPRPGDRHARRREHGDERDLDDVAERWRTPAGWRAAFQLAAVLGCAASWRAS